MHAHVGPAMQILYRDFNLNHLPDDLPIIKPDEANIPASAVKVVPQGGAGEQVSRPCSISAN